MFVTFGRNERFVLDIRVVVPILVLIVMAMIYVTFIVRPGTRGVWNLGDDVDTVSCPGLRECAEADTKARLDNWKTCDNVIRAYFWTIFTAIGKAPDDPAVPSSIYLKTKSKCGMIEASNADFAAIASFNAKVAGEVAPKEIGIPAEQKVGSNRPVASHSGKNRPNIIQTRIKSDAPEEPKSARMDPKHFRSEASDIHDAVLRALTSLDAIARVETDSELVRLSAHGAHHRFIERWLAHKTLSYRRRLGELKFLENAWFVGRLTTRSQWQIRQYDK